MIKSHSYQGIITLDGCDDLLSELSCKRVSFRGFPTLTVIRRTDIRRELTTNEVTHPTKTENQEQRTGIPLR